MSGGAAEDRLFFASRRSSSSSMSLQQQPAPTGAELSLYQSYMSDIHSRRLRKAKMPPPADAAGLIVGTKFNGRGTPLKGKGCAPPDNREEKHVSTRAFVAGASHAASSGLLTHHDASEPAAAAGGDGLDVTPHSSPGPRPAGRRTQDQSHKGGLGMSSEKVKKSLSKKKGEFAPTLNTERVLGGGPVADTDSIDDLFPPSKIRPWALQVAEAEGRQGSPLMRPQTAPPKLREANWTVARKQYHADYEGHQDVFRYRHSGGICPAEYKFAEQRLVSPKLETKPSGSAKEVFFDARASYSCNRVKSLMSTIEY